MKSKFGNNPTISNSSGMSLHRQMFLVLRDEIVRGVHPPEELLPGVEQLGQTFGVSGITIRRALTDLAAAGFVERRRGLGTFVRSTIPRVRHTANATFMQSLGELSEETKVKVLELATLVAPPEVASLLELDEGSPAVHAVRLRSMGKLPLMVMNAWIPPDICPKITVAELHAKPMYQIILGEGISYGRVIQEITAVAADPVLAKLLQCEVGSPLIRLTRLFHRIDGRPIEYLVGHVSPERSRVLMDISSEAVNGVSGGQIVHDSFYGSVKQQKTNNF